MKIRFLNKILLLFGCFIIYTLLMYSQTVTGYAKGGMSVDLEIDWTAQNYGTIQWQQSTDGGESWSDIENANSPVYVFTASEDALYRAKIDAQEACDPFFLVREIKIVNFDVTHVGQTFTSAEFEITQVDFAGAKIVEWGFCYNLSSLSRNFRHMYRVSVDEPLPQSDSFNLVCQDLQPNTIYSIRTYFKTEDGSLIFGPARIVNTLPGLKWTTEDWQINKNSVLIRFEIAGYNGDNPEVMLKFGETEESLSDVQITYQGNHKYVSPLIEGLSSHTGYIARVEATIEGEKQIITKEVNTLPDYKDVVVDKTTDGVKHTILWDSEEVLHRISPEGLSAEYPRMLRVDGKTLLCAYHAGTNNDHWLHIYLQKSYDNGETWTSPIVLMNKSTSFGANYYRIVNPEMIKLQNGWIVMSFVANGRPETNENCHVMVMTSKDNGETWGDPVIVGRGRTWEPMIVQLPNGELELLVASEAAWYPGDMYQEILYSRSTDNGETWTEFKRASYSPQRRDGMPVAVVMQGNKGILYAIEIVNDGGWGSPSLVHRALDEEWDETPWDNNDTDRRWHVHINGHGGAPYLIQLPTGEMVLTAHTGGSGIWQTGRPRVVIGDSDGRNFLPPVSPLTSLPITEGAYYNSLFLKDEKTVWLLVTNSEYEGTTRKKGEIKYLEGKIVELEP